MHKKYHLRERPIPEGFRIFEESLPLLGVQRRRAAAIAFCRGSNQELWFVREPWNTHDSNAIRIEASWKGWFFSRRKHLGYVPREVSARLVLLGLDAAVLPRLMKTYVGHDGYVEIEYQIVGPVERFRDYSPPSRREAAKDAVKTGNYEDAIIVFQAMISETEAEAESNGWGVSPAPYLDLAKLYRRMKRYDDEVRILERYAAQRKSPGVLPQQLAERLVKAKELLAKSRRKHDQG